MPTIDVTDVLYDGDIADEPFVVTRTPITARQSGIPLEQAPQIINAIGAISQASSRQLAILPEGTDVQDTISIITPTRLQLGNGTGFEPDIITWKGVDYKVMKINDWTSYGSGFVVALCTLSMINPGI